MISNIVKYVIYKIIVSVQRNFKTVLVIDFKKLFHCINHCIMLNLNPVYKINDIVVKPIPAYVYV
jgi:hypothetical protein